MISTRNYPVNKNFINVFDELFGAFPVNPANTTTANANAPVNITENELGYHLQFNVPGRNKEDFKINLDKGLLTVSYEKKEQEENKEIKSIRKEFALHSFKRSFSLDEKVNAEGIEAKYENGILHITLPKKEEVKIAPKQISIL
jgi:HSP20 family protein